MIYKILAFFFIGWFTVQVVYTGAKIVSRTSESACSQNLTIAESKLKEYAVYPQCNPSINLPPLESCEQQVKNYVAQEKTECMKQVNKCYGSVKYQLQLLTNSGSTQ